MRQRKLSVVTICYNSGNLIRPTIESILCQSFKDYEYIIIDGASKDNTLEIIRSYEDSFRAIDVELKVYSEKDTGIYNAMNKGIMKASGEWINFMNAGDRFHDKQTLSNVFSLTYGNADILYGQALRTFKDHTNVWRPKAIEVMWREMPFCHQSTFVRASYHKERLFDESFKIGADYDFFFDSYYNKKKIFHYLDYMISIYDMQGQSTVNSVIDAQENLKLSKKYGAVRSILFFRARIMYRLTLRPYILYIKDIKRKILTN